MRLIRRICAAALPALLVPCGTAFAGSIGGTVTNEATGQPVQGICVHVTEGFVDVPGSPALTNASGGWSITGLEGGYRVQFVDCRPTGSLVGEWYDDATQNDAAMVGVGPATAAVVNAALAQGGVITGTVTREGAGTPIEGMCVSAEPQDGPGASARTDADGHYRIIAPPGTYMVSSNSGCAAGKWVIESIEGVVVAAGATVSGQDLQLHEDLTPPTVAFTAPSPAEGGTSGPTVTFDATPNEAADLYCSLDGAAFTFCIPPVTLGGLSLGAHTFAVKAIDVYDNEGDAVTRHWSVVAGGGTGGGGGSAGGGGGSGGGGGGTDPGGSGGPTPPPTPAAQKCVVPKLAGKRLAKAKKLLAAAHCGVGKVTRAKKKGARKGTVIRSKPKAGTTKPAGTKVALVVAK